MIILRTILKGLKPFRLISLVMTYLLGAGLVQYVRDMKDWTVFFQGAAFLVLIYLSVEYLRLLQGLIDVQNWPDGMTVREARQVRLVMAMISATFFTVATSIFVIWMHSGIVWQGMLFLVLALLAVAGLYYLSYVVEKLRPFELLIEVLLFIVIPPAVAYFLQADEAHRLLTMVVVALVPGYLANRFLHLIQRFGPDQKSGVASIVVQIGWEKAMVYHNALILLTYLLFALIALLGFPWFLMWPVFLTLPIGLLEMWLMERVRLGMKPLWRVMEFATACVLFIPIYLVGFAFWIR